MNVAPPTEPFRFSATTADGNSSADSASVVNETRQEVQRLVREASSLVSSAKSESTFWPAFIDKILRATAGDAVYVFAVPDSDPVQQFSAGQTVLQSLSEHEASCHASLLAEVGARQEPVLVPPSTHDPESPPSAINPTPHLVILVPILVCEQTESVIEILMPTGAGPATQRGYLRFAAQMGDLAGEFLRSDALRTSRSNEAFLTQLDQVHEQLHQTLQLESTCASIVDGAARVFQMDRVTLLQKGNRDTWKVLAISGMPEFDPLSPTVGALEQFAGDQHCDNVSWELHELPEEDLRVCGQLPLDSDHRLVLQTGEEAASVPEPQRRHWLRFQGHASGAIRNCDTYHCVPLARLQSYFFSAGNRIGRSRRSLAACAIGALLLGCVSLFPVPLNVSTSCELVPLDEQVVYARADAVVTGVLVQHGDSVKQGQPLLKLYDEKLTEDLEKLTGEEAVLLQEMQQLRHASAVARSGRDDVDQSLSKHEVLQQKLAGIQQERELLERSLNALTICAQRDGVVSGWRIREKLLDRPVHRGQILMRVIDPEGGWILNASVPQNRLDHVLDAHHNSRTEGLMVDIVFRAFPDRPCRGRLTHLGMIAKTESGQPPTGHAEVLLETSELPIKESGAMATAAIPCGLRPLGYVVFEDLIRKLQSAVTIYL